MTFIDDDFMLNTEQAQALYHGYAKDLPIIDYHCHLPPEQVGENTQFDNLYQVWLAGDHYKWRAMRTNGVSEHYCTGRASDWEKFQKWAETVPYTLRNPLYHWTHLELRKPFNITDRLLSPETAKSIWDECNEKLATPEFRARGLIEQANVKVVCTTDDPIHDLAHHRAVAADASFSAAMLPTWRPDRAMAAQDPISYNQYLDRLAEVSDVNISRFEDLIRALQVRHDYFHQHGCRLSDHGLDIVVAVDYTEQEVAQIFTKVRSGQTLSAEELEKFQSAMLVEFAVQDHAKGWVQQYHIGPIRNNNPRLFREAGADTGFDSIGDQNYARPLAKFLGRLDDQNQLTKTILYNINPRDNEMLATMIGNFQDGSAPGKIQFGSGWWFNDQMDGMRRQLDALSQLSLLSRFVGMLTDSRSLLSYSRHEYFRRLLCRMLGEDMVNGYVPNDLSMIGKLISDVCYYNARDYFPFDVPE